MSAPEPLEAKLLAPAVAALDSSCGTNHDARLEVLEAAAAHVGGFSLAEFRREFSESDHMSAEDAKTAAIPVLGSITDSRVPVALALTALAREPLSVADRRASGAYYTDFRLATFVASQLSVSHVVPTLDPASGTGILLAASCLSRCGDDARARTAFVAHAAYAADTSRSALRGVRLSLASLTPDIEAIRSLNSHLRCHDSLVAGSAAWTDVAPDGFPCVIGNPPWEKLKLSRHEHAMSNGHLRHYGADYEDGQHDDLEFERARLAAYTEALTARYALHGAGEADLYRLFLNLMLDLLSPGGRLGAIVPAGLIRSQGTSALRSHLLRSCPGLSITIFDNKPRFFEIDTRFKFLVVVGARQTGSKRFYLSHGRSDDHAATQSPPVRIGVSDLRAIRGDLTVPEVRSRQEWALFHQLATTNPAVGDLGWPAAAVRELDMTRDRRKFRDVDDGASLPLIEGRMVHQFRHDAKAYLSGRGRAAAWATQPEPLGISPQFWVRMDDLPDTLQARAMTYRVGFCDITGQTNERAMLATAVPAGVICGNKVPTLVPPDVDHAHLILGLFNSLVFDWLLRRIITTTVNFFLLRSVPLPELTPTSGDGKDIAQLARAVASTEPPDRRDLLRARLDAAVARAYGLAQPDVALVCEDFPLLDRGQPPIEGEHRSTLTRDLVMAAFSQDPLAVARVESAFDRGAHGYIPGEWMLRQQSLR